MLVSLLINFVLVAATVIVHYEALYQMSRLMPRLSIKHRYRLVVGVLGAVTAHTVEIWLFALAYYYTMRSGEVGGLVGGEAQTLLNCAYYSFVTYTTLGFGDVVPTGSLRFLTGLEALIGLVLITWTASFLYIEMQKYWDHQ